MSAASTPRRLAARGAQQLRGGLSRAATRFPMARRVMERTAHELQLALGVDGREYGASYYGEGTAEGGEFTGYDTYTRETSNADVAAYLLWKYLGPERVLEVGCARGFVVEALRELGVDATGVDVSRWSVEHPAPGATGHVRFGDLRAGLPFRARRFDVVAAFETLEHLPPEDIPHAVAELKRAAADFVVVTIPSFGPNEHGPDGWLGSKVRHERLDELNQRLPDWDGPVDYEDLLRDEQGKPIEGHLTIASYRWWTAQFAAVGLRRAGALERRMHADLYRFGLTKYWNLYVFHRPRVEVPTAPVPPESEWREREQLWKLDQRRPEPDDRALYEAALGPAPDVG